jgi:16S rRNA G1207 methylase RsmC
MLAEALGEVRGTGINHAVVFNPGQGHIPVVLWKRLRPAKITLVDRDLLALRYSRLNLALNDYSSEKVDILHQVSIHSSSGEKTDLIAGVLRDEEGREAIKITLDRAAEMLADKGTILLSAGSTAITRLVEYAEGRGILRVRGRVRRRGCSLLVLEKA